LLENAIIFKRKSKKSEIENWKSLLNSIRNEKRKNIFLPNSQKTKLKDLLEIDLDLWKENIVTKFSQGIFNNNNNNNINNNNIQEEEDDDDYNYEDEVDEEKQVHL
jgi:hypothetical protein